MTAQPGGRKSRGRPRVDAVNVGVRIPPDQIAPLDAYIAGLPDPKPGRPEAIRAILAEWLAGRGYLAESTRAAVISQQPRGDVEPAPAAEPIVPAVIEAASPPDVSSEDAVQHVARTMCEAKGIDPDERDDRGAPMWKQFRANARADLLRLERDP